MEEIYESPEVIALECVVEKGYALSTGDVGVGDDPSIPD